MDYKKYFFHYSDSISELLKKVDTNLINDSGMNIKLYIETRPEGINESIIELMKKLKIDGFRGKSRYFRYFTTPKRLSLSLDPARREASGRGIWSLKKINLSNNSSELRSGSQSLRDRGSNLRTVAHF